MAENSAFWDDEATGDAASATGWEAPYLSSEKVDILSRLLGSDSSSGFVVPEYENELQIAESTPAAMTVDVNSGSGYVKGRVYINTVPTTLTITANSSGDPRIDRVILRVSIAAQTIRLVVLAGTSATNPILPTLTQDANTYEVSLAYIWVADGATTINNEDIHDEREFFMSFKSVGESCGNLNLIENSELLASRTSSPATPAFWLELDPSNQTWIIDTKPTQMGRGTSYKITSTNTDATAERGIQQEFFVKPDTMYAIRLLVKPSAGVVATVSITTDSYSPNTILRDIIKSDDWSDELFYYKTEHDSTTMTLTISLPPVSSNSIYVGQVIVVEGYYAGEFREFHECLIWGTLAFIADTYSTETVIWDVDSVSGLGFILEGTQSLFISPYIQEAYTVPVANYGAVVRSYGGTDTLLSLRSTPSTSALNHVNMYYGEVPLISRKFEVDYIASGVNTLTSGMIVFGIRT